MLKISKRRKRELAQGKAYHYSSVQEQELADSVGGVTTPASGAKELKGDVRVPNVARIECKATEKNSYALSRDTLRKIDEAGTSAGEIPYLEIAFLPNGDKWHGKVAVVPHYILKKIIEHGY